MGVVEPVCVSQVHSPLNGSLYSATDLGIHAFTVLPQTSRSQGAQDDEMSGRRSSRARKVVNYAELNDPHIPQMHNKEFLFLPNHHMPRTRKRGQHWNNNNEEEEEEEEEQRKERRHEVTTSSCQLFVSTEYQGDQEKWAEKENKLSDSFLGQEEEEREVQLVCKLPYELVLQSIELQCQQMIQKPDLSCEALPPSATLALESNLPPPLPPPLLPPPPPSRPSPNEFPSQTEALASNSLAVIQPHVTVTESLNDRPDNFSSCPGGSLCHSLKSSSGMEGSDLIDDAGMEGSDPLDDAASTCLHTQLHCMTIPEDCKLTDQQNLR